MLFPLFKVELACDNPVIKASDSSVHDLTDAFPASMVMAPATTIPLPTRATWLAPPTADPDLVLLRQAMETNANLDKSQLVNKGYQLAHNDGKFALEEVLLYHFEEPKRARVWHLQTQVVPSTLRCVVISACHSSPLAGHSGAY